MSLQIQFLDGFCDKCKVYTKFDFYPQLSMYFAVQKYKNPLYCRFDIDAHLDHHKKQEVFKIDTKTSPSCQEICDYTS